MKRLAGLMAALLLCSGFTCPDERVTQLVVVPLGSHYFAEYDANGIATLERQVFAVGDTASPLVFGRVGRSRDVTLSPPALRFSSSNPDVATISETGRITARSVGETRISFAYEALGDSLRVVVTPRAAALRLALDPATIRVGFTSTARATAYDSSGAPFPRTYYGVSVVDHAEVADGHAGNFLVSGRGAGTATVVARLAGQELEARSLITVTP